MALFSDRYFLVTVAVIVQFLALSANATAPAAGPAASTKLIDNVCHYAGDKAYCLKTLTENPSAVAAKSLVPLAEIVLTIGKTYATQTVAFIDEVVKKDRSRNATFAECRDAHQVIVNDYSSAYLELKSSPDTAVYDIMVAYDQTVRCLDTIAWNTDSVSKKILARNKQMNRYIDLAAGAANAVDAVSGDDSIPRA